MVIKAGVYGRVNHPSYEQGSNDDKTGSAVSSQTTSGPLIGPYLLMTHSALQGNMHEDKPFTRKSMGDIVHFYTQELSFTKHLLCLNEEVIFQL